MSERALQKLRRKFILAAMAALVATMLLIAGLLYTGTLVLNRQVVKSTLNYIIENNGDLITWEDSDEDDTTGLNIRLLEEIFTTNSGYKSPEFIFSTRYFAILYDENGNISEIKNSHISAVSEEEAKEYGALALSRFFSFGRVESYYYQVGEYEDGSTIVVYLDSSSMMRSNDRLLNLALILIGFGMILAFFLVRIAASRAIRTEIENAELQKQFLTNASHELKTPLAVIRANTEMEEMLQGESEWTQSTMRQVERMSGLIQNLVMISRADENNSHMEVTDVDVTKCIRETTENFQGLAQSAGKRLLAESIAENVRLSGDEAQIRQLTSLLIDNAIKYCDEEGEIDVALTAKGKNITLTVSNSYAAGENVDYTKFFERFYRADESHNTDVGGYGIGLSIAESLVKKYRGSIDVSWKKGIIYFTCVLKPVKI